MTNDSTSRRRFEIVGADFVEVSPPYDPSGITSLHEPASTSSGPFSTNAPSGADDTDRQAGVSAALRSQEITPYKWVHPNEER
jgi:hypothetical protein